MLSGGQAMMDRGNQSEAQKASPTPPLSSISPAQAVDAAMQGTDANAAANEANARGATLAAKEEQSFQALKKRIDALVKDAHLSDKVSTTVSSGSSRLLTDRLLFSSGSAVINPGAFHTLDEIGGIIAGERKHPVEVEGHTDDRPIHTSQYPSNWQLSRGPRRGRRAAARGGGRGAAAHVAGRLRRGASRQQQRDLRGTGDRPAPTARARRSWPRNASSPAASLSCRRPCDRRGRTA